MEITSDASLVRRHVLARPGPRHRLRHDRQPAPRHPDGRHHLRPGRHRHCPYGEGPAARVRCSTRLAVAAASTDVLDQARQLAADMLEANPATSWWTRPAGVCTSRAVQRHSPGANWRGGGGRPAAESSSRARVHVPVRAHVAVVEVDTETGRSSWCMITCDDSGTILNPLIVEGQRHGGIAQGVAQRSSKRCATTSTATPSPATWPLRMISATELPMFELVTMETPTRRTSWAPRASASRAPSARRPRCRTRWSTLSPPRLRTRDAATAERVWRTIQDAKG